MLITLTRRTNEQVLIDVMDDAGQSTVVPKIIHRFKDKDVRWLTRLNDEWTLPAVNVLLSELCEIDTDYPDEPRATAYEVDADPFAFSKLYDGKETKQDEVDVAIAASPPFGLTLEQPFVIHLRSLNQLKKDSFSYADVDPGEALKQAIVHGDIRVPLSEPVLEWADNRYLCCLDIDYHSLLLDGRPTYEELKHAVARIKVQPFAWHPSHGGGAKLYYLYKPGYTADELAAIGGIQWVHDDPRATFELANDSRHPCYDRKRDDRPPPCENASAIHYLYGLSDVSYLKRMLASNVDMSDIETLLSEKGWAFGQMLPHTECLISSTPDTKENVFVGEQGLYCHRCSALGLTGVDASGGGSAPGFVSYASMISIVDNRIKNMCRNFCHLEHAKIVLSNVYPLIPPKILEIIYRTLLKIVHTPEDPRIPRAMLAGQGFVRTSGMWVTADGTTPVMRYLQQFVKSLPATMVPTEQGFTTNTPVTTAFQNSGELARYGYDDINFIKGAKIYGQFHNYKNGEVVKVVTRKEFSRCPPTYVPPNKRMPVEDAYALLDSVFPGIDINYLKMAIAMKGVSEGRMAQCPYLLVTGPSGAGKTTIPHIAAGICGDKADEPTWTADMIRFRQSLMDASRHSGMLVINEVFKCARQAKLSATQALDPMLSLTEDSRSDVKYLSSMAFGRLPVFVLTDIDIPKDVQTDIQIARRFLFYRLERRTDWSPSITSLGIRPYQFRLVSTEHVAAADAIMSDVIDTFFRSDVSITRIAEELGAQSLENYSEELNSDKSQLLEFFKEVCRASGDTQSNTYPADAGWRKIDRQSQSPLSAVWSEMCNDLRTDEGFIASRVLTSQDWSKLLGREGPPVKLVIATRKSAVFVRFVVYGNPSSTKPTWINGRDV